MCTLRPSVWVGELPIRGEYGLHHVSISNHAYAFYTKALRFKLLCIDLVSTTMPHKEDNHLSIAELHPTFAAEVRGVDFSHELSPDVFDEVYQAITKVSPTITHTFQRQNPETLCSMAWSNSPKPGLMTPVTLPLPRGSAS